MLQQFQLKYKETMKKVFKNKKDEVAKVGGLPFIAERYPYLTAYFDGKVAEKLIEYETRPVPKGFEKYTHPVRALLWAILFMESEVRALDVEYHSSAFDVEDVEEELYDQLWATYVNLNHVNEDEDDDDSYGLIQAQIDFEVAVMEQYTSVYQACLDNVIYCIWNGSRTRLWKRNPEIAPYIAGILAASYWAGVAEQEEWGAYLHQHPWPGYKATHEGCSCQQREEAHHSDAYNSIKAQLATYWKDDKKFSPVFKEIKLGDI